MVASGAVLGRADMGKVMHGGSMDPTIAAQPRAHESPTANREAQRSAATATSVRLLWQHRAVLVLATLFVTVPFLGKPLHIDDPLFVWSAQHLQSDPVDFYGFNVNWFGYSAPMSDMMKNPPLASYYIAAAATLLGFGEVGLHTAQLLPTIAAVLGTFELARLLCRRPFLATLVALTTPVFVICASTLMCDVPFLALWVWSLVCWHRGLHEERQGLLLAGAVLATLAALTKYFGMCLVPLMLLDAIDVRRKATWGMLWLLVPVLAMLAFERVTESMYGFGLVSDAQSYASRANETEGAPRNLQGFFRLVVYIGGCVVGVALFAPRCWQYWTLGVTVVASLVLSFLALYRGWADVLQQVTSLTTGEGWRLFAHVFVFLLAGFTVLGLVVSDFAAQRQRSKLLLGGWMVGTLLFAGFVNWTINGRSVLPMVPALGILVARRLEETESDVAEKKWLDEISLRDAAPLLVGLAAAMLATAGDYEHAASARRAAEILARDHRPQDQQFTFVGHWGFQYYFEKLGVAPLDSSRIRFQEGDVVVAPLANTNTVLLPTELAEVKTAVTMNMKLPVATQRKQANAGFYGTSYGRLPWRLGSVPADQYLVQVLRRDFKLDLPPPAIR
ncbi:MAG: glycosyltransferase family 39 protein [Pirellulales bacterium]|nr:glycosyltransferase family 39 protein [Pirellulales bacterium]